MVLRTLNMIAYVAFAVLACFVSNLGANGLDAEPWQGTVTLCSGDVILQRGEQSLRVIRGGGLKAGDTISTRSDSRVAMILVDGPVIILNASTTAAIEQVDLQWRVNITKGEARVIHPGDTQLTVVSGALVLDLKRAIVQLEKQPAGGVFEVIDGEVVAQSMVHQASMVTGGNTFAVDSSGVIRRVDSSGTAWQLKPFEIRLAAAMQTEPVLQQPTPAALGASVNDDGNMEKPLLQPNEREEDEQFVQATPMNRGSGGSPLSDESSSSSASFFGGSSSLSLGALAGGTGAFFSGGIFSDNVNFSSEFATVALNDGPFSAGDPFPGYINFLTAETKVAFDGVALSSNETLDIFGSDTSKYYSIGAGARPSQIVIDYVDQFAADTHGTSVNPKTISILGTDHYLVEFDQYNVPDPAVPPGALGFTDIRTNVDVTGPDPTTQLKNGIVNATPLIDSRAKLNGAATFVFGDFRVIREGANGIAFAIRRSDQDRLIDPENTLNFDAVQPNSDVEFVDQRDPNFSSSVDAKVPTSLDPIGTNFRDLDFVRRAALTTLVADQLKAYAKRTGQTRFVFQDRIIDISGYPGH
ncbi:FecR domain-containing protein [Novipirellula caenicola]|uniref:FecR protein domain-containing protein n=1 Tax=Novipirellula caenicola TaxID=1536901 RepID=A0ABP9VP59_9BACT